MTDKLSGPELGVVATELVEAHYEPDPLVSDCCYADTVAYSELRGVLRGVLDLGNVERPEGYPVAVYPGQKPVGGYWPVGTAE